MGLHLSSIFDWQPTAAPKALKQRYLSIVANDLNFALSGGAPPADGGNVAADALARLLELPDAGLVRVVEAPETYHALSRSRTLHASELARTVHGWVDAECARVEASFAPRASVWSALGDAYFPAGAQARDLHARRDGAPAAWCEDEPFAAPVLHDSLVLDFFSPQSRRPLQASAYRTVQFGPTASLDASDRQLIVHRVSEALNRLNEAAPHACAFVRAVSRVIMLRRDAENPKFYTSSSSRAFIGRTTLVNPHLSDIDAAALSGSLIHEAIHAFLYMYELESPLFTDRDALQGVLVRSPWTGGELGVHTYIHACFVWFGLMQFWRSAGAGACYPRERVQHHRAAAETGFQRRVLEPLEPHRRHIGADWFDQLAELRA